MTCNDCGRNLPAVPDDVTTNPLRGESCNAQGQRDSSTKPIAEGVWQHVGLSKTMNNTYHFNAFLPEYQGSALISLKEQTGLSLSEIARRIFDRGLCESTLNEIIPSMSGHLQIGTQK